MRRAIAFAFVFWAALAGFVAIDWQRSTPHNRFNEPLPWQRNLVADARKLRRFVLRNHCEHECRFIHERWPASIAVVGRPHADRIVSAVARAGCQPQQRRAVALVDERGERRQPETAHAERRKHERIPIRIARRKRHL